MAQGSVGRLRIFEDFLSHEDLVANTGVPRQIGEFRVVGQGLAETDSGAPKIATFNSGAVRLTTTNETEHTLGIETNPQFIVGVNGTLVLEARVQFENTDTKESFVGFTDIEIASSVPSLETDLMTGATTTLTLTASDLVGFYQSADLTATTLWHTVYNGGATTGVTASEGLASTAIVDGEWQVLRLEIDPNGTARWFIDGTLVRTVAGAVSTTSTLKEFLAVEAKGAAIETMDIDYVLIEGNRDWTV